MRFPPYSNLGVHFSGDKSCQPGVSSKGSATKYHSLRQSVSLGPLFQAVNVSSESSSSKNSRFISVSTSGCGSPIT